MRTVPLISRLPEQKLLAAVCYDMGETRLRRSENFHVVRRIETAEGIHLTLGEDAFGLLVSIRLEFRENGFRVTVPPGGIVEWKSIRYRLMRLCVFPELMETEVGSPGCYLLPVSSGILVDFRERPYTHNTDRIYMDQAEWEKYSMLNCFGCLAPEKNLFCIVEEGDFFCQVDSEFNSGGINRIHATFLIRKKPGDMLRFEPMALVFSDAGTKADYDDFAFLYRKWFLSHGATLLRDRIKDNPVLAYSVDAVRVKIFMAQKYPYVPDGSTPVTVHADCGEVCRILDEMKNAGIEKAVVTLVGWNLGGHDGAYPSHFPIEPAIGGEEGLRELIRYAKELGYQIVPHDNWTDIYRNSADFDYEYVARDESQEPVAAGIWGGGQAYKACPMVQLRRYGHEFERIRALGFEGHYYLDAQSTALWTCHSPHHPANEKEFALALASITAIPRALFGAVSIECASAYSVPFIDEVSVIHFGHSSAGIDRLSPHFIPFFHIALHGLLLYNYSGVQRRSYQKEGCLYEIAFGARPGMEVSYRNNGGNGGDCHECLKRLLEPYQICFRQLKLQTVLIRSFKEPSPGIYRVTYENGMEIAVNTTDIPFEGLEPGSWKLS